MPQSLSSPPHTSSLIPADTGRRENLPFIALKGNLIQREERERESSMMLTNTCDSLLRPYWKIAGINAASSHFGEQKEDTQSHVTVREKAPGCFHSRYRQLS